MPPVIYIKETDSTNNYMKDLLLHEHVEEGTIVCAGFQTAGKGQRGNSWESENGKNLLFSIVLYPGMIKSCEQFIISRIISLAVAESLSKYTEDISIKWPNDIYWKNEKICGILIENTLLGESISQSVAGIGININQEKFAGNAPNPVSLKQIKGVDFELEQLLDDVINNILRHYQDLKNGNIYAIIANYRNILYRKTGYHLFNDHTNTFFARIKDIEPDGRLVLETKNGEERRFAFKEVKYIL